MASSPSGKATVCNTVITSSNLVEASIVIKASLYRLAFLFTG
jgi:hypothetical protein